MNQQIVNLRGIAILMVVLGHSIIIYDSTFELLKSEVQMPMFETLKHWISFVQMKLFISISGFLLAYKCLNTSKIAIGGGNFASNKAYRLLIPYICVLLVYNNPLKYLLGIPGYGDPKTFISEQLIGMNCAHLWYLPCLFLLMIIGYPIFCWAGKVLWRQLLIFVVSLGVNYFSGRFPGYFQVNEVGYYFLFFHLGYLVNWSRQLYPDQLNLLKKGQVMAPLILIAIVAGCVIRLATSIGFEVYLSILVLLLLYALMPSFNNSLINEISKKSYGLYLFHSPLIYITAIYTPNMNPWLMLFVNFFCFGGIAYMITLLLNRSKLKFIIGT